jgi:F-type H+-transporting ATPase subunit delta
LSQLYDRPVSLKVDVDPSILGGVSVQVGSDLYDGTILSRLNAARQAFAK